MRSAKKRNCASEQAPIIDSLPPSSLVSTPARRSNGDALRSTNCDVAHTPTLSCATLNSVCELLKPTPRGWKAISGGSRKLMTRLSARTTSAISKPGKSLCLLRNNLARPLFSSPSTPAVKPLPKHFINILSTLLSLPPSRKSCMKPDTPHSLPCATQDTTACSRQRPTLDFTLRTRQLQRARSDGGRSIRQPWAMRK
ncbi:hypothetical protein JCM10213v2_002313 [Rhodosporidiobolus nylandii]